MNKLGFGFMRLPVTDPKNAASVNYVHASPFYYKALTETRGKASDCIACGLCESNCPQNLPIRDFLKDVAAAFEK